MLIASKYFPFICQILEVRMVTNSRILDILDFKLYAECMRKIGTRTYIITEKSE